MEDMLKTSADVSEVVFDQPEEKAGSMVDEVLGATSGGKEENVKLHDIVVPSLHPEQQIRQEEVVQTPPRREPRRNEGHQPRVWALGVWQTSGKTQLVGNAKTTNGHL